MATVSDKIQQVKDKIAGVNLGGVTEKIEARHKVGRMTVHVQLHPFCTKGFHGELFRFIKHFSASFAIAMGANLAGVVGVAIAAGIMISTWG
jgi:hypothetical protein